MKYTLTLLLAGAAIARAEKPPEVPPVYEIALPDKVEFVAWLPVDKWGAQSRAQLAELAILDLRIDVVLPNDCQDRIAGLLPRNNELMGTAWDVVVERHRVGECRKQPSRLSARQSLLQGELRVGAGHPLVIGATTLHLARTAKGVTIDGQPPGGDVPGAPPTAMPAPLYRNEVLDARSIALRPISREGAWEATIGVTIRTAMAPASAPPIGMLASGTAATRFALTHFEPLSREPLFGEHGHEGSIVPHEFPVRTVVFLGRSGELPITVGKVALTLKAPKGEARK